MKDSLIHLHKGCKLYLNVVVRVIFRFCFDALWPFFVPSFSLYFIITVLNERKLSNLFLCCSCCSLSVAVLVAQTLQKHLPHSKHGTWNAKPNIKSVYFFKFIGTWSSFLVTNRAKEFFVFAHGCLSV